MSTVRAQAAGTDGAQVDAFIWDVVSAAFRALDQINGGGQAEITMRLLKIAEEYGETVQAWIGVTGQNPRKGVTHTRHQVADELGDVTITALVAACSMGFDPHQILAGAARNTARHDVPGSPPASGSSDTSSPDAGSGEQDALNGLLWAWVSAGVRSPTATSGAEPDEITVSLLRIAEEFGKAAQAWIGFTGHQMSDRVTHTRELVAGQLGEVAFSALVTAATMGFDPRQVLAGTAAKIAARLTIATPPGIEHHQPTEPEPLDRPALTAGPLSSGEAAGGDLFTLLVEIAAAQPRRYPQHNGPFARVARLDKQTGELAQQVNHAETTGAGTGTDEPFDPANLAAAVADVLLAASSIALHYDITDQVRSAVAARHGRDRGPIPAPPTNAGPATTGPGPAHVSAG